ncbi:MAG: DNA-protecting protein DprA [Candidatus Vogelbacteria bacterium]|nr:DNA-protecting protein DprA [Candidatus Vogelbacteria bacterium]
MTNKKIYDTIAVMRREITKLAPDEFPTALKEINDPPKALYLEGVLPDESYTYLTIVGSRRYSRYGQEAAERLIAGLIGYPIAVVSGLAIGLDTIAHRTALAAGLPTIAVPGSGLDRSALHPPSNRRLADKIVAAGGALLSELEPMAPAGIHTFPRRNRLMAGLAKAVLIIEAGEKSGTLITARLALDYNRDVLAIPGSIFAPTAFGTNQLIRQGATPITTSAELLLALGFEPKPGLKPAAENLSPIEQTVIELLSVEPLSRDDLIRRLKLAPNETNALLSLMEIGGLIKETLGEIRLV